ncbi:MAG: hypothetical protein P8Y70_00375 [Candidatus Lokiarchaeota archaeon]
MKRTKKYYNAIFKGKIKKRIRVDRFSEEDVLSEILELIPKEDDGEISIYNVDFLTDEKTLIKRIIVASELYLEEEKTSEYVFQKNYNI